MEVRNLKITFSKSGTSSGISGKLSIPKSWLDKLEITQDDRNVKITLDDKKIIIEKEINNMENLKNEVLNKEVSLLDLDNLVQRELNTKDSLFDNVNLALENDSWTYNNRINVIWELIEQNEDIFKTIVKVIEIEEI